MNVTETVPFLRVTSMEVSIPFYVDGLGFTMPNKWIVDEKIRWCWLTLGEASMMIQELSKPASGKLGEGVSVVFSCEDALAIFREITARGLKPSEPQVGNGLWNFSVMDPDGYRIEFASPTDVAEDTRLSELT